MPVIGYLLICLIVFVGLFSNGQTETNRVLAQAEVNAMVGNMLFYRNAVANYAEENPAVVGGIDDESLGLPTWYLKSPYLGNYLIGGRSYVFFSERLPGLVGELAKKTESINIGVNTNGFLISPTTGATGIALPPEVPLSAVVILQ